ncbi:hypothetical protein BH24ACT12_BH24ACT12_19270 [soil metagenome]
MPDRSAVPGDGHDVSAGGEGVEGSGDLGIAVGGVLVDQRGIGEECPSRRISSAVLAPVAAASVAPVCRSSCTRTGGNPHW